MGRLCVMAVECKYTENGQIFKRAVSNGLNNDGMMVELVHELTAGLIQAQ